MDATTDVHCYNMGTQRVTCDQECQKGCPGTTTTTPKVAICSVTDGSSPNLGYPCTCGESICGRNQACTASSNQCKAWSASDPTPSTTPSPAPAPPPATCGSTQADTCWFSDGSCENPGVEMQECREYSFSQSRTDTCGWG